MPPKRNTITRPSGAAKRGRANAGGRTKCVKEHARVLSDISEESTSQRPATREPEGLELRQRITRSSNKRSFQESMDGGDDTDSTPAAKRNKQEYATLFEQVNPQPSQTPSQDDIVHQVAYQDTPTANIMPPSSPYSPSFSLLFFVQLASLDTDDDTEQITLNLISLTLAEENWHPGLSGMVQPAACFLIASILTRRQNLVEHVASSVEVFGVGFEELVEGYALLWEWRANMAEAVGPFGNRLDDLPEPRLLLSQDYHNRLVTDGYEQGGYGDERPEPERWDGAVEV